MIEVFQKMLSLAVMKDWSNGVEHVGFRLTHTDVDNQRAKGPAQFF
jgi:hypothetical protein